jgi:hypothetical protein
VNAADDSGRAAFLDLSKHAIAGLTVAARNPDADDVALLDDGRIEALEAFVDDDRIADEVGGCCGCQDEQPARRHETEAERGDRRVDEHNLHKHLAGDVTGARTQILLGSPRIMAHRAVAVA